MGEETSLDELVLSYCRHVGGLIEPPAYGIYETLLPDEVAARWGVAPHQRFTFDAKSGEEQAGITFLHYGHTLVDAIINELHWQSANGQFFINNVRSEKPGLYAAIEKAISLPNAKLFPVPSAKEQARLHHYARFNFKVSLVADEKRELILPVWMDVQRGCSVNGADIEQTAILDIENGNRLLPLATCSWNDAPPLAPKTLASLLERASQAIPLELGETLANLRKRLERFLELDRARLDEYYADLRGDAEHRLQKADEERRPALEAKLAAIAAERVSKLADVEQKYNLRIQVEFINLAIIALPKLDLMVEIRKRTAAVQRSVAWNPLLHSMDLLTCDVCGQSGNALQLCENGHLAHAECLAPQCVECKRTYCQKCATEVQSCVVCKRPVCIHSLVRCADCQRITCHEHVGECHAEQGGPRHSLPAQEKPLQVAGESSRVDASTLKVESPPRQKAAPQQKTPKARTSFITTASLKPLADYMEVYADPGENTITAFAMVKKRELAVRWWSLVEDGLAVKCDCEKGPTCHENGLVYRPMDDIELQIKHQLNNFRVEYRLPETKLRYFQIRQGQPFIEKKLRVPMSWKEPTRLEQARKRFDVLKQR